MNENESLFVHAFNYTPIGMALVAPDGRWLKVNTALCNMFGYSEQEFLSTNFQAITFEEDLELDFKLMREALEGKIDKYNCEKRHYHQNGNIIWVSISSSLIRDEHENPLYFLSQTEDITERKKTTVELRHLEKLSELISESAQDMLIYLSPELIYQYVSPSLKSILGMKQKNLLGIWQWTFCTLMIFQNSQILIIFKSLMSSHLLVVYVINLVITFGLKTP
jgi:PAS domain S-box-containing protein